MGKLTVKVIGLCLLVILITNWSVSQVKVLRYKNFDPYRVNHLHHNLNDYNVLFVGSSRFGRQIDVKLFDSITTNLNFHSYNYSFDAAFAPTSINLANDVLKQSSSNLKVLILELAPIEFMGELDPGHVSRSVNWYSLYDLQFLYSSGSGASGSFYDQLETSLNRFYLTAYRMFSVGEFWKRSLLSKETCELAGTGANPLPELKKTPELILKLDEIRHSNSTERLASYNLDLSSSSYLIALNRLAKKCQKRNIRLLTVVAPKMEATGISFIESLAKLLNQKNLIRLNNADEYPALYSTELTADPGHLNAKGVQSFTEYLSLQVRQVIQQKK